MAPLNTIRSRNSCSSLGMSPTHPGLPPAYRLARQDPMPISPSTTPVPHAAACNPASKSSATARPSSSSMANFNPPAMMRSRTPNSSPNPIQPGGLGVPSHPSLRPSNPLGSSRTGAAAITADQLHQIQHRHQLEMALVKQEACALKEQKAFLVAQNLRLERELNLQSHALAPTGLGEQRRLDLPRPSFSRSRSHPNPDFRDPHRQLSMHSPTHSGSSSSSHPWPSSGGPSTPSSLSPRSLHSRNPSSASLAVPSAHAHGQSMSRRPSFTGGCGPDLAVLQRALRARSTAPGGGADDWAHPGARSNPSSAGASRRNSLTGSNGCEPPLKGILKPSTPIRPMSSCALAPGHPARRMSGMTGYFAEEGYDSITRPKTHRSAHSNSSLLNPHHLHQVPFSQPRSRRGSLDTVSGEVDRMRWCNSRGHA